MFLTLPSLSEDTLMCVCVCVCVCVRACVRACVCVCVCVVCPTHPVAPCGRDTYHIREEEESSSCVCCVKNLACVFMKCITCILMSICFFIFVSS